MEVAESMDELKSSCSVRGIQMPNFEILDARIASALNTMIPNILLQEEGQSRGTEGPKRRSFPSWKTARLPDLRVLPGHWSQRFC